MKIQLVSLYLYFRGLPKTLYFNLKYLSFRQAIRLPILVSHKVFLKQTKGKIVIPENLKFGKIQIGFGDVGIFDRWKQRTIWNVKGTVEFKGKAKIKHGSKITCSGELTFGDGFVISSNSIIICREKIIFGDGSGVSWDCLIMDTDFQIVRDEDDIYTNPNKEIIIGKNVLIGTNAKVLKGVNLPDYTIVSACSVVVKGITDSNCAIAGSPAKIIKKGVRWSE